MKTTQQTVNEALNTAIFENGYRDLIQGSPLSVAVDLLQHCSELEEIPARDVVACVIDYQIWWASHQGEPTAPRQ